MSLEVRNNTNNSLSLEEARKLLDDPAISDEALLSIIADLKILCEVAAHLYKKENINKAA
jgi:hypothetical protein